MINKRALDATTTLDEEATLRTALFRPMGVTGVMARTHLYETIVDSLEDFISEYRQPNTEVLRFPPVMSRRDLERHGYLKSFPNLIACACALRGTEDQIREAAECEGDGWTSALQPTDLVLSPAACYPVYPLVAARGCIPGGGLIFDVSAECFRREPAQELDRLQSFRMREYVCIGNADQVSTFRNSWMQRVHDFARRLALPYTLERASDPFFGRPGQMMAASQKLMALKFELLIPIHRLKRPTACMSFNYHRDHFGVTWNIQGPDCTPAHTGCVAFGIDRLALALFAQHGVEISRWPAKVKAALML